MNKHTPTPWFTDPSFNHESISAGPNGFLVADCSRTGGDKDEYQANAAFIVRAVNSYEEMLKGLYELRDRLVMGQDSSGNSEINQDEIDLINRLIAKAEGK